MCGKQRFWVMAILVIAIGTLIACDRVAFEMLKYGRFEPSVPGYEFVREKVEEAWVAMVEGVDVAYTLANLNQEVNLYLAEQNISPLPAAIP